MDNKKTCPVCGYRGYKRHRGKYCPECGARLYIYKPKKKDKPSVWVAEEKNLGELVDALERYIASEYVIPRFRFSNRLPELAMARTLYEKCNFNQSLALLVIRRYFTTSRKIIWYRPKSMAQVLWDNSQGGCFSTALSLAKMDHANVIQNLEQVKEMI